MGCISNLAEIQAHIASNLTDSSALDIDLVKISSYTVQFGYIVILMLLHFCRSHF
jgi:hypothetical protein